MSTIDFYAVLGVPPSASQDDIRSAHRQLVKRFHPDIYSTSGDKARATKKLQAINQAYAVLGNPERRKEYDAGRVGPKRSSEPVAQERPSHSSRPRSAPRPQPPHRTVRVRKKFQWKKKFFAHPWLAGTAAGLTLFVVAAYSFNGEPQYLPVWFLVQKTDIEPAASGSPATEWEPLGRFGVAAACMKELKNRVRLDEEEGSHALFDELRGSVAITVLLIGNNAAQKGKDLPAGKESVTKRVRQYHCRAAQIRQPDSWLRRQLRQAGLVR